MCLGGADTSQLSGKNKSSKKGIRLFVIKVGILLFPLIFHQLFATAIAQDFPITFEHIYGVTEVEKKPEKVVSLSFLSHDNFLALGFTPDAIRYWYGNHEYGVWPWAEKELGDKKPLVLKGSINLEQIASLDPDVIEATWSGITESQYKLLSRIAPVVPPLEGNTAYSMPWDEMALTIGKIIGEEDEAKNQISAIKHRIANVRLRHPQWEGKSAVVAFYSVDSPGAYGPLDIRPQFLSTLGFETPEVIADLAGDGSFIASISAEDLSPLDADVLFWFALNESALDSIRSLALRRTLDSHKQGREIYVTPLLTSSFSHVSLLSLPYVLDELVPLLEKALDGDPSTIVQTSQEAGLTP
tara:strand:+ start:1367 stop:2434 length:1068 start_codon:yes stop_codon:yes gene_type:complete